MVIDLLRADLEAMCEGRPIGPARILGRMLVHARWRVLVYYRLSHAGMASVLTRGIALWLADRILRISGAELQPDSQIGPGLVLKHTTGLVVGHGVIAGRNLTLHQNVTLGDRRPFGGQPVLGDDVTVGAGACVLGPVHLGDRVIVAANSVVLADVPPDSTVAGSPARIVSQESTAAAKSLRSPSAEGGHRAYS